MLAIAPKTIGQGPRMGDLRTSSRSGSKPFWFARVNAASSAWQHIARENELRLGCLFWFRSTRSMERFDVRSAHPNGRVEVRKARRQVSPISAYGTFRTRRDGCGPLNRGDARGRSAASLLSRLVHPRWRTKEHCIERQREARSQAGSWIGTSVAVYCTQNWPSDWRMFMHCVNEQTKAESRIR